MGTDAGGGGPSGRVVQVRPAPAQDNLALEDSPDSPGSGPSQPGEDILCNSVVLRQGGHVGGDGDGADAGGQTQMGDPPPPPPALSPTNETNVSRLPPAPIDDPLRRLLNR